MISKIPAIVTPANKGLAPKTPNDNTKFLDGTGAYSVPTGTGGGLTQLTGDVTAGPGTGSQVATINPTAIAGRLIGIQYLTTTGAGTYTPTTGTTSIIMELLGGGAGGSGVASAGVNQVNLGGGGGSGAYLRKRLTAAFSGAAYVVGAKGTGGASGNNNGTDGADTTFTATGGGGTVYTAGKGIKGVPRTSFAPPITNGGGAGGTATNGDINIPGADGFAGIAPNQFVGYASGGGASHYGPYTPSALVSNAASAAGANGGGYGTGGSGAVSSNAGGAQAGGNGADGILIIWEFA